MTLGDTDVNLDSISEGEVPDENLLRVIDVVHSYNLQEVQLDKKSFSSSFKDYLKRVREHVNAHTDIDEKTFMRDAKDLFKDKIGKIDDLTFYTDSDYNMDAMIVIGEYVEGEDAPLLTFIGAGLKEEKL